MFRIQLQVLKLLFAMSKVLSKDLGIASNPEPTEDQPEGQEGEEN